jgi:hypothetical protein
MKKSLIILGIVLASTWQAQAQKNIVNELEKKVAGEGTVHIVADASINALIGQPIATVDISSNNNSLKTNGFRIVVYLGNDPKKAKGEAAYRQTQIRENFPEITTYIRYEAPNWKLFAGDFISRESAESTMQKFRKQFPEFGKELFITSDKINLFY